MINLHPVSSFEEKLELVRDIDPFNQTWVVSDLRSKFEIQKQLLQKTSVLEETSILRASELWNTLASRVLWDYQIFSKDLVSLLIQKSLSQHPEEWVRRPGTPSLVFDYMTQLMPILSHPEGEEILSEWFTEYPNSKASWGEWAELVFFVWKKMLNEKVLSHHWVTGALLNQSLNSEVKWHQPLWIDLGAEIRPMEVELLKHMSISQEVHLVMPSESWQKKYASSLHAYSVLEDADAKIEEKSIEKKNEHQFLRFTTMLSEVKNAVSQCREWLEKGIPAEKISIVAPDIEVYWPSLQIHLQFEGVPVTKKKMMRLQTVPVVGQWLSRLKIELGILKRADLETTLFDTDKESSISYEEFERLFTLVFGKDDLKRSKQTLKSLDIKDDINPDDMLRMKEFLTWSLQYWPASNAGAKSLDILESALHRVYQEGPLHIDLDYKSWTFFLESLLAKVESEIESSAASVGIQCLNLHSAEYSDAEHVLILGASESFLQDQVNSCIPSFDQLVLQQQTGFVLDPLEEQKKQFAFDWLLAKENTQFVVSFSETDFSGSPLSPSILWLQGLVQQGNATGELSLPKESRWDEWQKLSLDSKEKSLEWNDNWKKINQAKEYLISSSIEFFSQQVKSLSATSIERYLECPFKFASEKVLGLSDLPSLDLDVDRMTRGQLLHKILEKSLPLERADSSVWRMDEKEIESLVEESLRESQAHFLDPDIWQATKKKYVSLLKRFLEFEASWQQEFPLTQTLGKEVLVRGLIDIESGELRPLDENYASPHFLFRGAIDRVDGDGDVYSVLDYKSSKGQLKMFVSWIASHQLQMALYAMAIEEGLTPLPRKDVVSGNYYIIKSLNRETGFKCLDQGEKLYSINNRSKNKMSLEDKEKLFFELKEVLKDVGERVFTGAFQPQPNDEKSCLTCKWKKLCRAPHLN